MKEEHQFSITLTFKILIGSKIQCYISRILKTGFYDFYKINVLHDHVLFTLDICKL